MRGCCVYANGGHNLWRSVYNQHVGGVALDVVVSLVGGWGGVLKTLGAESRCVCVCFFLFLFFLCGWGGVITLMALERM